MERVEELFEIGGPMIIEELGPDKRMIEPEELLEIFVTKRPLPVLVEIPGRDPSTAGLVRPCCISENTTCYHPE